jgi:hypothetical protein
MTKIIHAIRTLVLIAVPMTIIAVFGKSQLVSYPGNGFD